MLSSPAPVASEHRIRTNGSDGQGIWRRSVALFVLLALAGCGGSKVLKEAEPFVVEESLAATSDEHLAATLDWVIYRDGPGTWATNVDWDEYLIRVRNLGDAPIRITHISVFDSLGTRIEAQTNRRKLVEGAREARRRYNDDDLQIGASWQSRRAARATATAMGTGALVGAATYSGWILTTAEAAAAGAVAGGIVVLPALAASGVVRGMNHSEVEEGIKARQTLLPATLQAGEERNLRIFFPLTPSPRRVEIVYSDDSGQQIVALHTLGALQGLHLADGATQ